MLVMLVLLVGLFLRCSTSELDSIDPFEFVTEEFDDIPDVVEVADPEPEVAEVRSGEVKNLEVVSELTTAIIQAVESGGELELAEETNQAIKNVETVTNSVLTAALESDDQEQLDEVLENFDEDEVEALLSEETVLSEAQSKLAKAFEESTELETVSSLFPQIVLSDDFLILDEEFPEDFDLTLEVLRKDFGSSMRMLTLVGPCAESANSAYEAAVATLDEQRDANIAVIEGNYQRRLGDADTRLEKRNDDLDLEVRTTLASIRSNVDIIIATSRRTAELGDEERARELRAYAVMYCYTSRAEVFSWLVSAREMIRRFRIKEVGEVTDIRNERLAEVTANYNRSLAAANAAREEALGSCHNQGAVN